LLGGLTIHPPVAYLLVLHCWSALPDYLMSSDLSFNYFKQQLKHFYSVNNGTSPSTTVAHWCCWCALQMHVKYLLSYLWNICQKLRKLVGSRQIYWNNNQAYSFGPPGIWMAIAVYSMQLCWLHPSHESLTKPRIRYWRWFAI